MIRGAIEVVEPMKVSGWIYCGSESLRDKLVMAFVGTRCVGTGKIDRFRKDLLEAKLGDGYCGFDFPVKFLPDENRGSLVIRLQNSDVALLQSASRVLGVVNDAADDSVLPDMGAVPPGSVTWMQDHGWLEQHEHDFLKAVHTVGAYERGLRTTRRVGDDAVPAAKPEIVARNTLGLYMLGHVDIVRSHAASFAELIADKSAWHKNGVSVVGLWSEEHTWISVAERSHIGPRAGRGKLLSDSPPGGIDYQFGPDRILFLHRDCSFAPYKGAAPTGIVLFSGLPKLPFTRATARLETMSTKAKATVKAA